MNEPKPKFNLPEEEEKILEFWEKNKIFEESIRQRKNAKRFVFYDGPPFATGLPHYGHILASTIKDVVPRYWTMRGFRVDRRWGWDCHGLPIETLVEQELNISGKKSIRKYGIKKFNEAARSKVLAYTAEWYKTVRRIGRFVDFKNYYSTMDPTYMESVWWAFSALYKKGLVYQDSRTALFCPRCETQLSNFEIAMDNSYRDQEDDSVYVKLPIQGAKNEYLLIWTTTPWTLPGNAAVAVNPKIEYTKYKIGSEYFWSATTPPYEPGAQISVYEKASGKFLLGRKYLPLFSLTDDASAYRVVGAEFVDTKEGTGLVHIAPAFGEEDFLLGKREKLPLIATLDDTGSFSGEYALLKFLAGKKTAEANKLIIAWLKENNYLWKVQKIFHRYPVCWRCQTPLIYKVEPAWFVKISAFKKKMLALNEEIDWHPEHLKHGRFGNGLETAPDWNISRSRFWGTPIPIWECTGCKKIQVIGSREEFHKASGGAKNEYFIIRHGEALNNSKDVISYSLDEKYRLTLKGRGQVERAAVGLKKKKIDLIISSDIPRTKETAEIVGKALSIKPVFDKRLREIDMGVFEGRPPKEFHALFASHIEKFSIRPPGGENLADVRTRALDFLKEVEAKYSGKNILIVSHEDPLWMLYAGAGGLTNKESLVLKESNPKDNFIRFAEVLEMPYKILPRNDYGELDFHLPYVDQVEIYCQHCGGEARRIPDVFDCWFESGSMPYAEKHYPFENKKLFEQNFPAHFIAEYIAQTRGWFYNLHVLSTALFGKPAFRHAVTTGTILSEKGEKLSKSRQNFPDPWLLFGRYGVDAMRFYLMASPVMLADNINFSEKDVDEVYKKYSLISCNVLNFFKLYSPHPKRGTDKTSNHVLDRWIKSRLHSTIRTVTESFDHYEIAGATRPLLGFVQDLSLWYVRRSRERFKSDTGDAVAALATLARVLYDFSRLTAPLTPFLAEIIYRELPRGQKSSVHLEDWPQWNKKFIDVRLEKQMDQVRTIVSGALRLRAEARIKVRQPLAKLQITNNKLQKTPELLELIKDEVNVKKITFGGELKLDAKITPELKEEGIVREFMRNIQEMRRDLGLKPKQVIRIQVSGDKGLESILARWETAVKKDTNSKELKIGGKKMFQAERELEFGEKELWAGVRTA